ncbi:MAG: ATP-binding protein [Kofleriaceae bacterium]
MDYRAVFREAATPLLLLDKDHRVKELNRCAIDRFGDIVGVKLHFDESPVEIGGFPCTVRKQALDDCELVTVCEVLGSSNEVADSARLNAFERRLETARALGRVLARSTNLEETLPRTLAVLAGYDDWDVGGIWLPLSEGRFQCYGTWTKPEIQAPNLVAVASSTTSGTSEMLARVVKTGRAEKMAIDPQRGVLSAAAGAVGLRRCLGFPIFSGERVLGVVILASTQPGSLAMFEQGLLDSAGQMLGLFVERMRAEQRLQEIVDTLHEGIIIVDDKAKVLYFNPTAKRHYGFIGSDEEWVQQLEGGTAFETRLLDGTLVLPKDRPSAMLRRGEPVTGIEMWVTNHVTGIQRALRYSGARLIQPDGSKTIVVAFSDITARVRNAMELAELNDTLERRVTERTAELEAANRELEAFTYTVSHDLRAPVRAITSFSEIVIEDFGEVLGAEGVRLLKRIHNGGVRLGELVDDLLAFSRLGRHALHLREIDVDDLVRTVLATQLEGVTNVELSVASLGTCVADASLLELVWTNLIENAIKYSAPRERIQLAISRSDTPAAVTYTITDNGVGFDMQYSDKLFGVFQRLHANELFEGTGVGLANVRRIVERHGGTVAARGVPEQGATFEFSLPKR